MRGSSSSTLFADSGKDTRDRGVPVVIFSVAAAKVQVVQ